MASKVRYETGKWSLASKAEQIGEDLEQVKRTIEHVRSLPFFPRKNTPDGMYVNGKPAEFEAWEDGK